MISLDLSSEKTSSSPINLSVPQEEPKVSFSDLLKGVKDIKDSKNIQNGSLILSLDSKLDSKKIDVDSLNTPVIKKETFNSLLKTEDKLVLDEKVTLKETKDILELNPKLTQNLSVKEIKGLVADAKKYLKTQILNSDGYKKSQIKELPKTLKGLAEVAKNLGIDVSKITFEEVKPISTTKDAIPKDMQKVVVDDTQRDKKIVQNNGQNIKNEMQSTPLFKVREKTEYTTQQLVQIKQLKVEEKSPKIKADETLKLLLRGEKPSSSTIGSIMTSDFSVATAKVIAPDALTETSKSLEQLLHGEKDNSSLNSKVEVISTHKTDSFEVKLNEAKQMIKYISQDVKTAIEDYKPPFTRIKVQLNPQKLGEVDLTVIQRGKNLHVNISSNNTAINTLSLNANELRVQLNNNGINNATLNFNNQDSNSQSSQQEQNKQRERKAHDEYNYFENEEENEEILSSLEIIIPQYI
jgi:flagellar hook-length control protein FliK